jgi:hypothetical protein
MKQFPKSGHSFFMVLASESQPWHLEGHCLNVYLIHFSVEGFCSNSLLFNALIGIKWVVLVDNRRLLVTQIVNNLNFLTICISTVFFRVEHPETEFLLTELTITSPEMLSDFAFIC